MDYFQESSGLSKTAQLCLHPDKSDYISMAVDAGAYKDCLVQTKQWDSKHQKQVYLEIGAHVGVCVLEMLLNTKATVVAVEAHPKNLFSLTSTLLKNPKLLERISVLPVALGKETTPNAALVLPKLDDYATVTIASDQLGTVAMDRLDDLLYPGGVQQVSLNVNGYECNVIDGGIKFMRKLSTLTFAVSPDGLEKYGCTSEVLLAKVEATVGQTKWYRGATGRLRPTPTKRQGFIGVAKKKF